MASSKSLAPNLIPGEQQLGSILLPPTRTEFYVPIPKNGTSSLRATLYEWRAEDTRLGIPDLPGWVFIRHPVERWFSGLKEATFHHGYGRNWDDMVAAAYDGKFVWDNHTRPQVQFVAPFTNLELIKFERASEFVLERYGREFAWERHRFWDRVDDLVPLVAEYYAEDMELYDRAA